VSPDPDGFELADRSVQLLLQEFLARAEPLTPSLSIGFEAGGSARLQLFSGARIPSLRLQQLTVSVDGSEPQTVRYDAAQAQALSVHRGFDQLSVLSLPPGPHRLLASYSARSGDRVMEGSLDREVMLPDGESRIEIVLQRASPFDAPALSLTEWRSDTPKPGLLARLAGPREAAPAIAHYEIGSADDPVLHHAQYRLDSGDALGAVRILQRETDAHEDWHTIPPPDVSALLAQSLLAYGLPDAAQQALAQSGDLQRGPLAEAAIALADDRYRHGDAAAALSLLTALPGRLPEAQRKPAFALRARALMSLQRDVEAVPLLAAIQPDPVKLLAASPDEIRDGLLLQYNFAVALMRAGKLEQGRGLLDRIGLFPAVDDNALTLRDDANLALGWSFLRDAQGATARPVLERVRLDGPVSNRALLGLGWAGLAPQGQKQSRQDVTSATGARDTPKFVLNALQRRRLIDCEEFNRRILAPPNQCSESASFDRGAKPEDRKALAQGALLPWLELLKRDADDAAVQEVRTAIPYALGQLGERAEARRYYEVAIPEYEAALSRTSAAIERLQQQTLITANVPEDRVRPGAFTPQTVQVSNALIPYGLGELLDSTRFAVLLEDLGTIAWMRASLPEPTSNPDSQQPPAERDAFLAGLAEAEQRTHSAIDQLALAALTDRQQRLMQYLEAARSGLARSYDPALGDAAPR
jgi:hypothetical protein